MSNNIDQISQSLGRLEADAKSARSQRQTLFDLLEKLNGLVSDIKSELAVHKVTDERHRAEIDELKKDVGAIKVSRIKAATALTIIAGLGAGAWEGAGKVAGMLGKVVGN